MRTRGALHRTGTLVMSLAVVIATVSVFTPAVDAVVVNPGTLGDFENDGDLVNQAGGAALDWENMAGVVTVTDGQDPDDEFTEGSKETDLNTWTCAPDGGQSPPKDDFERIYVAQQLTGDDAFLHLAWVRAVGEGSASIFYEFNQLDQTLLGGCVPVRAPGDIRVEYNFDGQGQSVSTEVVAYTWDGTQWIDQGLTAAQVHGATFVAANKNGTIEDPLAGETLESRTFGEATLDLLAVTGDGGSDGCTTFGSVQARGRSSSGGDTSALHDRIAPEQVDLSTCGSITLHKVDDTGADLAGATFGLFATEAHAIARTPHVDSCVTGLDGTCSFSGVDPGTWYVAEISAPQNHDLDPTIETVVVGFLDEVVIDYSFVDPRHRGDLLVRKTTVGGTGTFAFDVACDDGSQTSFELDTSQANPITTTALEGLVVGTHCDVTEQDPGASWLTQPDTRAVGVTISRGDNLAAFTNTFLPDLDILLVKSGVAAAHEGDLVAYDFTVTNTGDGDLFDVQLADDVCDDGTLQQLSNGDGDQTLSPAEIWTYSCTTVIPGGAADPFPNTATVTAVDEFDRQVDSKDDHEIDILKPSIAVDKTGPALAHVGDDVTFTITVTNDGEDPLNSVLVTDLDPQCHDGLVPISIGDDAVLAVDEVWTFECTRTMSALDPDPFVNVVDVSGRDDLQLEVTDSDDHPVEVIAPSIALVKSGAAAAHEGDEVTYTFTATNDGDTDLFGVELTDPVCDPGTIVATSTGDDDEGDVLSVGESWSWECTTVIPAGADDPFPNLATVTALDALEDVVEATDAHEIDIIHPAIDIEKSGPDSAADGDVITYTFVVTNIGDTPLANVVVNDDRCDGAPVRVVGTSDLLVAAEVWFIDIGDILGVADQWAYTCEATIPAEGAEDPYPNTATVEGTDLLDRTVDDEDTHRVDLIRPGIQVTKTGTAVAHVGDTVDYQMTVTNTGEDDLFGVTLSDPVCDGDTLTRTDDGDGDEADVLSPGEVWAYTCTHVVLDSDEDPLPNIATANGADELGNEVEDSAVHEVDLIHPVIEIDKTATPGTINSGEEVTYSYEVTNVGDVRLVNVVVVDDILGPIGVIDVLDPFETVTLTKVAIMTSGDPLVNVGTATGTDPLGVDVSDDDDATIVINEVLGEVIEPPPAPPKTEVLDEVLARTGLGANGLLELAGAMFLAGLALVIVAERRRGEA